MMQRFELTQSENMLTAQSVESLIRPGRELPPISGSIADTSIRHSVTSMGRRSRADRPRAIEGGTAGCTPVCTARYLPSLFGSLAPFSSEPGLPNGQGSPMPTGQVGYGDLKRGWLASASCRSKL
jgi:hypothetical protein